MTSHSRASKYRALILDLDGTLIPDSGLLRPGVVKSLQSARDQGVIVMVATGRSSVSAHPILMELKLNTPALTFNGVALYDPKSQSHISHMHLSQACIHNCVDYAMHNNSMCVAMEDIKKYCLDPKTEAEKLALFDMSELSYTGEQQLRDSKSIRISMFSDQHANSQDFADELSNCIDEPVYMTHFPLNWLSHHRESSLLVCDVQPQSQGKAEVFAHLKQEHGILPSETVTVGDATNDIEMLEQAGLGVAMGNAVEPLLPYADRVIGNCDSDAIADLVEELFLSTS